MQFKEIKLNVEKLRTVKILSIGDYQVGKTTFLNRHIDSSVSGFNEYCQVYTKFINVSDLANQRIGIQIYELPSNFNPIYNTCYLQINFDGIIFFYDVKIRRTRNCFFKLIKHIFHTNLQRLWKVPILIIGLKKHKLTNSYMVEQQQDAFNAFKNIIQHQNILFLENGQSKNQQEKSKFNKFIITLVKNKFSSNPQDQQDLKKYFLINSYKTYYCFFTYTELINLAITQAKNIWHAKFNSKNKND